MTDKTTNDLMFVCGSCGKRFATSRMFVEHQCILRPGEIVHVTEQELKDMVNHPPHYKKGRFETIDVIEDIAAQYTDPVHAVLVAQVLRYLSRAPHKGAYAEDIRKAEWYAKRLAEKL